MNSKNINVQLYLKNVIIILIILQKLKLILIINLIFFILHFILHTIFFLYNNNVQNILKNNSLI